MSELVLNESPEMEMTPSFHAVAVNATEMTAQRDHIGSFLRAKTRALDLELQEMTAAYEVARTRKWASSALKNQVRRITSQKNYYDKLLAAVDMGATIVPNMPCDIFAIRVDKATPRTKYQHGKGNTEWSAAPIVRDEKEKHLPIGEGLYVSPVREFDQESHKQTVDGKEIIHVNQTIRDYEDIEFPLAAAHPVVMEAADAAMKSLIFDRIGIVPATRRKLRGDPIILGQIVRKDGYNEKVTSFLIAWHLDVRTL
jgi:hypothetical protein